MSLWVKNSMIMLTTFLLLVWDTPMLTLNERNFDLKATFVFLGKGGVGLASSLFFKTIDSSVVFALINNYSTLYTCFVFFFLIYFPTVDRALLVIFFVRASCPVLIKEPFLA